MRRTKVVTLIAILLAGFIGIFSILPAHAVITFVGSGSNVSSVVVSSIVVTYTSSANHFVVVEVIDDGTVSTVTDNAAGGSSVFTKLLSKTTGSLDFVEEWSTTFSGSKAATSFTVTFTGNVDDAVVIVGEYAGATGIGVTSNNNAPGGSSTQTITATVSASNSWSICAIGIQANVAQTASVGNMRSNAHTTVFSGLALVDNTGGASSNVCATTTGLSPSNAETAVDLKAQAFDYSLSNNGPLSISAGATRTVTITVTSIALPQAVTLSCVSLPTGFTCNSFTNNPGTPTFSSVLSFTVAISVNPGSYSFNVTGTPLGATTTQTKVTVTVLAFDYSLSNNSPVTITQGNFGIVVITATNISTPRSITLSCGTLPTGVACQNFTPVSGTPTFTSNLAVAVTAFVTPGVYKFNVTGTALGATTTPTLVTINVVPPANCTGFFPLSFILEIVFLAVAIILTRFGLISMFFALIIMIMEVVFVGAPQYYVVQCNGAVATQQLFLPLLINGWIGTFFIIGAYWVVTNIFHLYGRTPLGRRRKLIA